MGETKPLDVTAAMKVLREALTSDPDYRYSWQANIAMFVYDACHRAGIKRR